MIAQPDLSSPPSTVVPSLRMTSPSTIGCTPLARDDGVHVRREEERRARRPCPRRARAALPVVPPTLVPASSTQISAPRSRSSRLSRSAIAVLFPRMAVDVRYQLEEGGRSDVHVRYRSGHRGSLYMRRRASKPAPERRNAGDPSRITGIGLRGGVDAGCEAAQSLTDEDTRSRGGPSSTAGRPGVQRTAATAHAL